MHKKLAGAFLALALLGSAGIASASGLTADQANQILNLLVAFKVDAGTITSVAGDLGVSAPPSAASAAGVFGTPGLPAIGTVTANVSSSGCLDLPKDLQLQPGDTDASTGGWVTKLQQFLGMDQSYISGTYGLVTQQAVGQWQAAHNIVTSGDPVSTGYGRVGPKTKDKMACTAANTTTTTTTTNTAAAGTSITITSPTTQTVSYPVITGTAIGTPQVTLSLIDANGKDWAFNTWQHLAVVNGQWTSPISYWMLPDGTYTLLAYNDTNGAPATSRVLLSKTSMTVKTAITTGQPTTPFITFDSGGSFTSSSGYPTLSGTTNVPSLYIDIRNVLDDPIIRAPTSGTGALTVINGHFSGTPVTSLPALQPGNYTLNAFNNICGSSGCDKLLAVGSLTITKSDAVNVCSNGLNVSSYPTCSCPSGTSQSGSSCIATPVVCGNGLDGTSYPSCACPNGYSQSGAWCVQTCAALGEAGTYPNCSVTTSTSLCSNGLNKTLYPSCSCPSNQVLSGTTCVGYGSYGSATGTFSSASCSTLTGSAYDPNQGSSPIIVNILEAGKTVVNGYTSGSNVAPGATFSFSTPASLQDGKTHTLTATVIASGSSQSTDIGTKSLMCPALAPFTNPLESAKLDQPNLASSVKYVTISGTANVDTLYISILKDGVAVEGIPVVRVYSGHWDTVLSFFVPVLLQNGSYTLNVYSSSDNALLTSGTLSVSGM